eukprot:TRINITY_DN72162_c0_g1_i1.p1 TRINITY_DN72162_c0_g1~~TRINITY_DN72162_c0_g1_i1.p1  ORF type:complete len:212 (+),score=72.91 TRINITY_DN72162_c0_g1_i1:72-638(+)
MAARQTIFFLLSVVISAAAFPETCSAYTECGALEGSCCPNKHGVMLDCCIMGSIRMKAEAAEAHAKNASAAALVAQIKAHQKQQAAKIAMQAALRAADVAKQAAAASQKAKAAAQAASDQLAQKAAAAAAAAEAARKESQEFKNIHEKIHASKCENNPACAALNLTGYCCPTLRGISLNGTMLGCCGA